jgi:choline dehydrogenase-like flavoprotein
MDVLIAGTGAGGATFGYALAKAGRSVLFVEQGPDLDAPEALRGAPPEATSHYRSADATERRDLLIRAGRNPEAYGDGVSADSFVPFIGYGTGGSSSLYGMVLERRYPHDFEGWPIAYQDLAPWYAAAESLYEVTGSTDPLRHHEPGCPEPSVPLSEGNHALFAQLRRGGLHPYRLHMASRRLTNCTLCQGYLCNSIERCKNDARVTCLAPAVRTGNARLLANARVVRLEFANRRIQAAIVQIDGREVRLTAKIYVLAAGALSTPQILLNSDVANRSGLVGRRLMRHAIDLFVLALGPRYQHARESKEVGLNDYYATRSGEWLGTIQSFGMTPTLDYLRNRPGRNLWRMLGPAAVPICRLFSKAPIMASILEDKPAADNRVEVSRTGARILYRLPAADAARRSELRWKVLRGFARFAPVPVFGTTDRQALGHVCGTTVFGENPQKSVLNPANRAHDVDNLYVVDGSFFPTSGGVNPALTIMANALRVAHHVHSEVL